MCAEQSSVELAGEAVKCQVPPTEIEPIMRVLVVVNLAALRATKTLEHQRSK